MGNVVLKPTRLPAHHPKRKRKKLFRGLVVTLGAMLLTTVAIRASDTFTIPGKDLLGGVGASVPDARCPDDMVFVSDAQGGFCMDRYEASAGKLCPHVSPTNQFDTNDNLAQSLCTPVSVSGARPWVNVPRAQAIELCARVGKHLPTNREWYRAAIGTPDDPSSCVIGKIGASEAQKTGSQSACISPSGVYDMVGNVWEWVDANVADGTLDGKTLPKEGYLAEVDTNGIPIETKEVGDPVFHDDFFFIDPAGPKGVFRGGFWSMTEKAGVNTVNAASPPNFVGNAVGFRCAR